MGQTAVVTGATSGIGAAIVKALVGDGDRVFGLARSADKLDALKAELGGGFVPVACDLRDRSALKGAAEQVLAEAPKLDLLVNNAGLLRFGDAHAFSDEDMDAQVETMLIGTFLACRAFLPALIQDGGGLIVNIASASGEKASPKMGVYGAIKAGIINYTKTLAAEYAEQGVRAVCVSPGTVKTGLVNKFMLASLAKNVPLKRLASPEEVAACIAYLKSPAASYMTGSSITLDGGVAL